MKQCGLLSLLVAASLIGCGGSGDAGKAKSKPEANKADSKAKAENNKAQPKSTAGETAKSPSGLAVVPIVAIYTLPAADGKPLTVADAKRFLDDSANHEPILPEAPIGLGDIAGMIPADNPITKAKAELGRMLYYDTRLSKDSTVSCASCHDPGKGYTDNAPVSTGIGGQRGGRSAPTVMNRLFGTKVQFWDGRANSLEAQAVGPIANPIEMGHTLPDLVKRLEGIEVYKLFFDRIYKGVSADAIGKSIATFERTVLCGDACNDYFTLAEPGLKMSKETFDSLEPDEQAEVNKRKSEYEKHKLSDAALRGRQLYFSEKTKCATCHVGANLSDELFHNIGVGMDKKEPDVGRFAETKKDVDKGAFKTPTLRNIALTAPYMHDGSQKTLKEVIDFYDKGGHPNPHLSDKIKKLNLTEQEKKDLQAFLETGLASSLPDVKPPRLP